MIMLTFATSEVLVIIVTVLTCSVESNNKCQDAAVIWPCTCEFFKWIDGTDIYCENENWALTKEALKNISSENMNCLFIKNKALAEFDLDSIKHIEMSCLDLEFPNLVRIDGDMSQTRKRSKVKIEISGGSFVETPLYAFRRIRVKILVISNNKKLITIESGEYGVLEHPSSLSRLSYIFNGLKYIEDGAFKSLTMLETLDLNYNKLEFISPDILPITGKLTFIDLSLNEFKRLPRKFVKLYLSFGNHKDIKLCLDNFNLKDGLTRDDWDVMMSGSSKVVIDFGGIRFNCSSCALIPVVKKAALTNQFPVLRANCGYPKEHEGKFVKDISKNDLTHCH